MTIKFTEAAIKNFTCPAGKKDKLYFDSDVKGLALRVTIKGSKIFLLRWTDKITGKKRFLPLNSFGSITLGDARDAAKVHLGDIAKGKDPIADRDAAAQKAEAKQQELKLTLKTLIDEWEANHLIQRSPKYRKDATRALRIGFAEFLKRPAIRLSKDDAITILDEIKKYNGETMAAMTWSYGRAMYRWGIKRNMIKENPFENLPFEAVKPQRDRFLTDDELGKVYKAAETIAYPWGPYDRLRALTGQRRNELAGMRWSELSDDFSTWTIPATRAKNNKGHIVHLSQPAQKILKEIKKSPYYNLKANLVFTTTGTTPISGFSKAKIYLDEVSGVHNWRGHDWRRTMVTWLAKNSVDHVTADILLNHKAGGSMSSIARVYQQNDYLPERKEALNKWAKHVLKCASAAGLPEKESGNTKQPKPSLKKKKKAK